jgi:triosephosphate isomerase
VSWANRLVGRGQRGSNPRGGEGSTGGNSREGRKPLISGNWKMNHTHLDAINMVQKLAFRLDHADYDATNISLHPAFTALRSIQTLLDADRIPIALGAQDVHWEERGAFTGEVSPIMLAKLNVSYVIVGHSERRQLFGETDQTANAKVRAVVQAGMTPILCVGETLEQREADHTEEHVLGQVTAGLAGLAPDAVGGAVVAYEPLWAIGAGQTATPADAQAVCALIRSAVGADFGEEAAQSLRIQYGGSVAPDSVAALMAQPDIDGALVGGASLDADLFAAVISAARGVGPGAAAGAAPAR